MKKAVILIVIMAFVVMGFNTSQPIAKKITINTESSTITWKGYKPTGSHVGSLNFVSGELEVNGDKLKGGNFTVDMTTIKESESNARLENHLKSKDFFEVEAFPIAEFKITNVNHNDGKIEVKGDMTIKGITKEISFPATLSNDGNTVVLTSETFQVNRADFNVKYKSKTFFNDLKDKFVNDDFDLQITIRTN